LTQSQLTELLETESARSLIEAGEERGWVEPAELEAFAVENDLGDPEIQDVVRELERIGLEVREPVLDHRLVEFAASLPSRFKLDQYRRDWKKCLKDAARPLLPRPLLERPKWGFGGPVEAWMRRGLEPIARRLLARSRAVATGLIDDTVLRRYLDDGAPHDLGRQPARLWNLLSLELWARTYIDGKGRQPCDALAELAR